MARHDVGATNVVHASVSRNRANCDESGAQTNNQTNAHHLPRTAHLFSYIISPNARTVEPPTLKKWREALAKKQEKQNQQIFISFINENMKTNESIAIVVKRNKIVHSMHENRPVPDQNRQTTRVRWRR